MRKIFLFLLIISSTISFSKNINEYESKKIFDKIMDLYKNGDYEKFKNDKSMNRILNVSGSNLTNERQYMDGPHCLQHIDKLCNDINYEIISIKETKNNSVINIKLSIHKIIDTEEKILEEFSKLHLQRSPEEQEYIFYEDIANSYINSRDRLKYEIIEKTTSIYMDKVNGLWQLSKNKNENFYDDICSPFSYYLDYF